MGGTADLAVRVAADMKEFEKGAQDMQTRLKDLGGRVSKTGGTLTKWVTGPIAGAAAGLLALGTKMGNTADEILDLSSVTGMSTEAIQEWRAVSDRAGVSTDAVAKASEMLTKSMSRGEEGSADMRDAMETLGLSMDEVRAMSPDERMETLITSLQGVDDAGKRAELGTKLLRNGFQELAPILDMTEDEMQSVIDGAHESGRIMGDEALENADAFRKGLDELKGEFMGLFHSVMGDVMPMLTDSLLPMIKDNIVPAIRGFAETIGGLISWFANLNPAVQKVIAVIIALAAAAGPVLLIVGKIITVMATLAPLLGVLKVAFLALTGPIGLIIAAIAAAVAIGWYLYNNWDEVKELVIELWETVREFFVELWTNLKEWFFELLESISEFFTEKWVALKEWFFELLESIWEFIQEWGLWILAAILGPVALIALAVYENWEEIKAFTINIFEAVRDFFVELWTNLKEWFFVLIEDLINYFKENWEEMQEFFADLLENIADFFRNAWQDMYGFFSDILNNIFDTFRTIWDSLWDYFSDIVSTITATVTGAFTTLRDTLAGIWDAIQTRVIDTWNNIATGIKGVINSILGFFNAIPSGIQSAVNSVGSAINRLPSITVPSWVPRFGGRSFSFPSFPSVSLPSIPLLDTGGIVQGPGLFEVGAGVTEMVTPLDGRHSQGHSQPDKCDIYVMLDSRQIAKAVGAPLVGEITVKTGIRG